MKTWKDKLAAVFYGPSWQPGSPRLGAEEDKIKVNLISSLMNCAVKYSFKQNINYR